MPNFVYSLLSHSWSGLLVAAIVAAAGALLVRLGSVRRRWLRTTGVVVMLAAGAAGVGGTVALLRFRRAARDFPPPGRLVDVGGYRMHILAEGDAKGGPTVVWITGSHDAGAQLYHLHKALRMETRSIIFDRPGSGWSDVGPFPRLTSREAVEMATLFDRAGERGPFILVGHSYGGLLAANFARRYPDRVAAVVMADGTPPDVFMYMPDGRGPAIPEGLVERGRALAWQRLFGLGPAVADVAAPGDTAMANLLATIDRRLTDVNPALRAQALLPDWSTPSIFEEWRDPKNIADLLVYDRELGDMPVFVVTPDGGASAPEVQAMGVRAAETERARHFLAYARKRYVAISARSELIHTPAGTGHLYPYQTPEFLLDVIRRAMADSTVKARLHR